MKTLILLVVTSVVLVVTSRSVKHHNLNRILTLANVSLAETNRTFVEDVKDLVSGTNKCQKAFFCKVENILRNHEHFGADAEMVRNLASHNKDRKCDLANLEQTRSNDQIELRQLLLHLITCIQHQNFNRPQI